VLAYAGEEEAALIDGEVEALTSLVEEEDVPEKKEKLRELQAEMTTQRRLCQARHADVC
jgi:hypothetical protein